MHIRSTVILKILLVSITCIIGCSKEPPTAPMNDVEGNCVGTVKNETGSPAAGASLMLVPEGYSPLSTANGSAIDSTTSDAYGRYGFIVDAPGAYNLLAISKGFYAMRRTIRISADARVILDEEILREPGSMSGMVHLQGESDHRGAIILLTGTNVYAKPFDSTGTFSVAALAEGPYTLRILTAENGYAVAETTITVTSGMQTTLPCIELQKKFVPIIDSLSVAYDPVMMRAVLSWRAIDTAKIRNYAVYCNHSKNFEPIAIVDKSATTYSFDIIASPLDTFLFDISAIGNDNIEGPSTLAKPLVKYSAIDLDTITSAVPLNVMSSQPFCFDRKDNIFTHLRNKITKLDPKGNYLGEFVLPDTTTAGYIFGHIAQLRTDTAGNLYALISSWPSWSLMKFDNDLQLVNEVPLDSSRNFTIAVTATGAFILYSQDRRDNAPPGTYWWIYDPQFSLVEKDSIPETLSIGYSVTSNDTTICLFEDNHGWSRVAYFDHAFNEISPRLDIGSRIDELSSSVPPECHLGGLVLVLKNLFAAGCGEAQGPRMLLFFDDHLQPVARMPYYPPMYPFGPFVHFTFDCKGNCYFILESDDYNKILKFSVAKVLK